ncbi:serine-pyruvate transaminase protein [Salinisphaera shabanensis E1L3A]|uniref:Serine-pyruvate transaminase protein n=1 Tax=Salinisphaera shabanensis E1L3A TaxID=1033802 RepID=U2FMY5_9GAMM|nr:serine-pyruvate transaminase protein [Salinisphaera shabanensis]ERJ17559.1 serine-pyruvate transaminase protein [Salinisphaera shabanensis E1L3A]
MSYRSGRHFLQIPGPTNVPDRVLHAMSYPTIDHRGPDFQALGADVLERIRPIFGTTNPVIIFPGFGYRSVGSGAGEYAFAGRPGAHV